MSGSGSIFFKIILADNISNDEKADWIASVFNGCASPIDLAACQAEYAEMRRHLRQLRKEAGDTAMEGVKNLPALSENFDEYLASIADPEEQIAFITDQLEKVRLRAEWMNKSISTLADESKKYLTAFNIMAMAERKTKAFGMKVSQETEDLLNMFETEGKTVIGLQQDHVEDMENGGELLAKAQRRKPPNSSH